MSKITRITQHDGTIIDVSSNIADSLAFEGVLRKNKAWGPLASNTLRFVMFQAWHAAKRTEQTTQTWDEFSSGDTAALSVDNIDTDDDDNDDDDDDLEVEGAGFDTPTGAPTL
ncbi:hypothetical protein [Cryobacterium sp. Y62]|uniref:hypothetical protein n=1 Tax=Cryobacterium sp. Y62 TaxID=2048284 RepID=UPI000CE369B2|nr:hypothetical protein [Cryobacterium sp. Y62]